TIDITASGGTCPYTYLWSDNSTAEDRTGLGAGTYSVVVKDANNCSVTSANVTITEPSQIVVAIDGSTNVTCFGAANGTISITASGGTGPHTYLWSDNSTSEDRTGLGAGTYSVVVKDANNCSVKIGR